MNDLSLADLSPVSQHYLVPDVRCANCCLTIERALDGMSGIRDLNVSYAEKRLSFVAESKPAADRLLQSLSELGYQVFPDTDGQHLEVYQAERRKLLARLGVAGIGMMQVMMFALAGYVAGPAGIEPGYEALMRWASLVIAIPVTFYSAMPFHQGAWRDLANRSLGMDVPVSLAVLSAFTLSTVNTLYGVREVYFDSACMFTFFLLTGRYLELSARQNFHVAQTLGDHLLPEQARLADGSFVALTSLAGGELLRVLPGEAIPADGFVTAGRSCLDESAFTGEAEPVGKQPGGKLLAGSVNLDGELTFQVEGSQPDWVISHLSELYRKAAAFRPSFAILADRVARYFVALILLLASAAGFYWWSVGSPDYFAIALSVMVVSCPCALSLATPVAYTIATGAVRRLGVLIRAGAFLEKLAQVDAVVLDKTGTLTEGTMALARVDLVRTDESEVDEARAIAIAAAVEQGSLHPIAVTLRELATKQISVESPRTEPGRGAIAVIDGDEYRVGKPSWASDELIPSPTADGNWVLLTRNHTPVAWFLFSDRVREGAGAMVAALKPLVSRLLAFSGDSSMAGRQTLANLNLDDPRMSMTPEAKIEGVRGLQAEGHRVLMIGDGLNDAGALATADVSLAVNPVDTIVQSAADATLVNGALGSIPTLVRYAGRVRAIIRQNLTWAVLYNLSVIPLAAAGFVAPWVAALGMSLSSLLVTLNACRLARTG